VLTCAIDAAARTGDERSAMRAAVVRGAVRFRTDPTWALDETRALADSAIATFTELDDDGGLAQALRLLSITNAWHCQWQGMADALERARLHAERAGDSSSRATIVAWRNVAMYYGPTPADEAIVHYEKVLDAVDEESIVGGSTSCLLAAVLAMRGRFDDARRYASRGAMILRELGQLVRLGNSRAYIADAERLAGDTRAAEHELEEAYATFSEIGHKSGALSAAWELASVLCEVGRYDDADRWAALGRDVLGKSDVMTRVTGLATEARLAARADRDVDALDLARQAVELADRTDALNVRAGAWLALAQVLRLDENNAGADEAVRTAVRLYEAKGNVVAARSAGGALSSPAPS